MSLKIGDMVETIKGARFRGKIIGLHDNDGERPGATVEAVHPHFAGTRHVYPLAQLQAAPDSQPIWRGPHITDAEALDELRRSVATMIGEDPATWPAHGNAPLAIAAAFALLQQQAPKWLPPDTAPKDATIVILLVRQDDDALTSFADSFDPYQTIGFNALADTGEDEWQHAGWDWSHDCFTDGRGTVIGWRPFELLPEAAR